MGPSLLLDHGRNNYVDSNSTSQWSSSEQERLERCKSGGCTEFEVAVIAPLLRGVWRVLQLGLHMQSPTRLRSHARSPDVTQFLTQAGIPSVDVRSEQRRRLLRD